MKRNTRQTGIFIKNRRGFGFVEKEDKQENEKDIYIAPADQKGAMTGDTVEVDLIPAHFWDGDRPEGIITRIIKHSITESVGIFIRKDRICKVMPFDRKNGMFVKVWPENSSGAQTGDVVTAEIIRYPERGKDAEGRVTGIVAKRDDAQADLKALIRSKGILSTFPSSAKAQAAAIEKAGISEEEYEGRRDLRKWNIFTIDGKDSKDFDDAVSIEKLENGNFLLGVHIADVAEYVTEGSALDQEALKRGNSIYCMNLVVPMLPEELSNGICSLNEGVDRLTLSCTMEVTRAGKVVDHDIFESVIRSKHRLVYDDISDLIENGDEVQKMRYEDIYEDLMTMNELYEILAAKREARGSIDFDVDEAYIHLDEYGIPTKITLAERRTANRLIEEFMLLANETVAEHYYWLNMPFIYRVHEKPEMKKMSELKVFLQRLGVPFRGDIANMHPKILSSILDSVKDETFENVVGTVMLRSMQKAYYGTDCGGHFGLSLQYYSHFTSPIRRYPDLFIHRVIKYHLHGMLDEEKMELLATKAVEASDSSSKTERTAMEIERQAEKMKKAEYMSKRIGKIYDGIVSGVTRFGIFVELENTIEGLVRLENMGDDYYESFPEEYKVIGERTGKTYELGDKVSVQVYSADPMLGEIDFLLESRKSKKRKKSYRRKRR